MASAFTHLVSEPQPVLAPIHARAGEVLVVFRNGRPFKAMRAGRKFRPGLSYGNLEAVAVSCASHTVECGVEDIVLTDAFTLPKVTMHARVALRDDGRYETLMQRLHDHGLAFVEHVEIELRDELDRIVRESFAAWTHEQVYGRNVRHQVDWTGPIVDKLFELQRIDHVDVAPDPNFVRVRAIGSETAVSLAESRAAAIRESAQINVDRVAAERQRLIAQYVDLRLKEQADRRELSVLAYENPELYAEERAQRRELLAKAIENADKLRRNPDMLKALGVAINPELPPPGDQPFDPGSSGRAALSRPRFPTPTPLSTDESLLDIWEHAGLERDHVFGIGHAQDKGRTVVLAVIAGDGHGLDIRQLLTELREQSSGTPEVVTISFQPFLDNLLTSYLSSRLPHAVADKELQWHLEESDGALQAQLEVVGGRSAPLRREILDASGLVIEPLQAVLPYRTINIDLLDG